MTHPNKVGLDIGSFAVKITEISQVADKPRLSGFGSRVIGPTPADKISDLIKELAEDSKISAKEVSISVSGSPVIVRFISMPKMTETELRAAIKFEAEKVMPFNINDCIVDFQLLKKDEYGNKINVLLVAVKREHIQKKIALVEKAGFSVRCVDVDIFAFTNAFLRNFQGMEAERTVALLNIGAAYTNLSILKSGVIYFARDIAIGGNDIAAAIVKNMSVTPEFAEALKAGPAFKLQEVAAATKQTVNNLLDEIKLSFSYHENQTGRAIDEVYLSGGSSGLSWLAEAFQDTLGSKPSFWNPLQFLDIGSGDIDIAALDKIKSYLTVSVGLALR